MSEFPSRNKEHIRSPTRGATASSAADGCSLIQPIRDRITGRPGYSSLTAGWSEHVLVESWTLGPSEWPEIVLQRHRVAVFLGRNPVRVSAKVDGTTIDNLATAGHIRVLPQGVCARSSWSAPLHLAVLELSPGLVDRLLDGPNPSASGHLLPHCYVADAFVHGLTRRIVDELKQPTERLYGEMLSVILATHILQRYGRSRVDTGLKVRLSALRARRVLEYMHVNLGCHLTIAALAQVAGLSEAHFARGFRAAFAESPHRMLLRLRLERALYLATRKRFSLADAAAAAGFYDQSHFANAVRRYFGVTPRQLLT
jgi:AraC family transcriptional regulator